MQSWTDRTRARASSLAVGVTLALLAAPVAAGTEVPFDRGIDRACDERAKEADRFADVGSEATHAAAIGCLSAYNVVQGRFVEGRNVYEPDDRVTRQQMASFVASSLAQLPDRHYALPAADDAPVFVDAAAISDAHEPNVSRLRAAGIVSGYEDGTYRPEAAISRAQMATFIAGAIEAVTGEELPRTAAFDDVSGPHQANIEKLTAIGVVQGRSQSSYAPSAGTTRGQMASFIAGALDHFVEEGLLVPVAFAPGTPGARLGLTDVRTGVHEDHDRVTLTLAGDDRLAGWTVRYVDEAVAQGSGHDVEVAGEAILEVTLTGMALPPELDEDLWDGGRLTVDGEGIVEIVDQSVYEGYHQLFIGTTGLHTFSVDRLADPQRVYIDVSHAPR